MQFNNRRFGDAFKPFHISPFSSNKQDEGTSPVPPGFYNWIDNNGNQYVDQNGNIYIMNILDLPYFITQDYEFVVTEDGDPIIF